MSNSLLDIAAKRRKKVAEVGFKCLCCDDRYFVRDEYVRQFYDPMYGYHELIDGEWVQILDPEVDPPIPTVIPYVCSRRGCEAAWIMVDVPQESGIITKRLPRIGERVKVLTLPEDVCQKIHDHTLALLRDGERDSSPRSPKIAPKPVKSDRRMQSVGAVMKGAPDPVVDVVAYAAESIDEVGGFRVGDRAVLSIDHLGKESQKEIMKGRGLPLDQVVVIESFFVSGLARELGLTGSDIYTAVVKVPNESQPYKVKVGYLREVA